MASDFDDLLSVVDAAVDDVFGDDAILTPRIIEAYDEASTDPERYAVAIRGAFSDGPGTGYLNGGASGGFSGGLMADALIAEFWIAANQAAKISFDVAVGDALQLTGRPGAPVYFVTAIQRTDAGDVNLALTQESEGA